MALQLPEDKHANSLLKGYLIALIGGTRPTYKKILSFIRSANNTKASYALLCEGGYLEKTPFSRVTCKLYAVNPEVWGLYGLTKPAWPGNDALAAALSGKELVAYQAVKAFFMLHTHLPGPSDLVPSLAKSRQRVEQRIQTLQALKCLPVARKSGKSRK